MPSWIVHVTLGWLFPNSQRLILVSHSWSVTENINTSSCPSVSIWFSFHPLYPFSVGSSLYIQIKKARKCTKNITATTTDPFPAFPCHLCPHHFWPGPFSLLPATDRPPAGDPVHLLEDHRAPSSQLWLRWITSAQESKGNFFTALYGQQACPMCDLRPKIDSCTVIFSRNFKKSHIL